MVTPLSAQDALLPFNVIFTLLLSSYSALISRSVNISDTASESASESASVSKADSVSLLSADSSSLSVMVTETVSVFFTLSAFAVLPQAVSASAIMSEIATVLFFIYFPPVKNEIIFLVLWSSSYRRKPYKL